VAIFADVFCLICDEETMQNANAEKHAFRKRQKNDKKLTDISELRIEATRQLVLEVVSEKYE